MELLALQKVSLFSVRPGGNLVMQMNAGSATAFYL